MLSRIKGSLVAALVLTLSFSTVFYAEQGKKSPKAAAVGTEALSDALLWQEPKDISTRDLYYGTGGKDHQPIGKFIFKQEDKNGTNPKFEVEDENGVKWKVKLGYEAQSEVGATRLVWAMGYTVDEDYYLPQIQVEGLPKLKRGHKYQTAENTVIGARLERNIKGQKRIDRWDWFNNQFKDTKELDGLKVMMALINNWDLKKENNAIYKEADGRIRYAVNDLGEAFGDGHHYLMGTANNLNDFLKTRFITKITSDRVDFQINSRMPWYMFFDVKLYRENAGFEAIGKNIPIDHVRWIAGLLSQVSDAQISDAFKASGYNDNQVAAYTKKIRERIEELKKI